MKTYRLILKSTPSSINDLQKWIDAIAIDNKVCEEVYPDILVCLTEAVSNAIHHGNKCDSNKRIRLLCRRKNNQLEFKVSDEGNGFYLDEIPDPTSFDRIEQENGRGVMIMHRLAHEVKFKKQGSKVIMRFKVD